MKIIVTGGAGFVGTNLIKRLLEDEHEVVSLDNYSTGFKENEQEGCKYYNLDLAEEGAPLEDYLSNLPGGYEVIYHMAALARIQPSIVKPHITLKNNFMSTLNILDYAKRHNSQVIYAGSSTRHHGIFNSPYAWSKLAGEHLCELYSNLYDLNTSICRFYNVYGKYHIDSGDYATVLAIFERQYLNNESLTITNKGEQRRDFTHVDDIVDALVSCIGKDFRAEDFELGRGVNYSINEIADCFGEDYPKEYLPERPGEYDMTLADSSKAKELLDWNPTHNIKDYIKQWIYEQKKTYQ
ncbi:NAD-dependent epimerase/dehydratase family protein [Candidatus Woesearchaeota archaeon]|nr:NAD-dependent epimerase/dehydratase family protein [Candidatus Woesearchaeota archaeon]